MLGRLYWGTGRKLRLVPENLLGIPVLTLELPERCRSPERVIKKGSTQLIRNGVTRVLTPPRFGYWPFLQKAGLRPVETRTLRSALAPVWVSVVLARNGVPPEQALICLKGERENNDMERVARMLCPVVRNVIIDVPGQTTLPYRLHREFGTPVLPPGSVPCDLTVLFAPGAVLDGANYGWRNGELPSDCEPLPLLHILWENGQIKTKEIEIWV